MTTISDLPPASFENLVYDLIVSSGFSNVVWRTPGADGGRDIEAHYPVVDAVGIQRMEKWYIECKRYSSSINWPLVYEKIAHADALNADYVLLATNSNPSPQCETRIDEWNATKRPFVRVWRGYQIDEILSGHAWLSVKYELKVGPVANAIAFEPALLEISKIVVAANGIREFGGSVEKALNAACSLSELVHKRMSDIGQYKRPAYLHSWVAKPEYWLSMPEVINLEEVGTLTLSSAIRFICDSDSIEITVEGDIYIIRAVSSKNKIRKSSERLIRLIASLTNIEILSIFEEETHITARTLS